MAKNNNAAKKEGAVNLREKTKVRGTDKKGSKLVAGKEYDVHPLTAENLIKSGHAEAVK